VARAAELLPRRLASMQSRLSLHFFKRINKQKNALNKKNFIASNPAKTMPRHKACQDTKKGGFGRHGVFLSK
jgi:hypothetical protein